MKYPTKHSLTSALALVAFATFAPAGSVPNILNETFENYTLGDSNGQGGWVDFGGPRPANVVNTIASSGTQSLEFSTNPGYGSDSTLDLTAPITSGMIGLTFDIYQPTGFDGKANIFLSRGPTLNSTYDEGLHLIGNGTAGTFSDTGSPSTPLLFDQWVTVTVSIDLDANTAVATYGDTEIFNGAWNNGGLSPNQFQGINIWASEGVNTAGFNIDNLRLTRIGPIVAWGDDDFGLISNAPPGNDFVDITVGVRTAYALRLDGSIVAWGEDSYGQVSDAPTGGGFTAIAASWIGEHAYALRTDGSIAAWGKNRSNAVSSTPAGTGFTKIASGFAYGLALRADGSIAAWGANQSGAVTSAPGGTGFTAIAAAINENLALRADGSLAAWGANNFGHLSNVPAGTGFTDIALNNVVAFALRADGSIAAWGNDFVGGVSGAPSGTGFTAITGSERVGFALRADRSIAAWGQSLPSRSVPAGTDFRALAAVNNTGFAIGGTAVFRPEIDVKPSAASELADGRGVVAFGIVAAGTSSQPKTITITNTGTAELNGLALTKDGADAASFTLGALGGTSLPPGASTTFDVTFSPATAAPALATVRIASNDANENPFDIKLSGNARFTVVAGTGNLGDGVSIFPFSNTVGNGGNGSINGGNADFDGSAGGSSSLFWRAASSPSLSGRLEDSVDWAFPDFGGFGPDPREGATNGTDNWVKIIRDGDGAVSWAQFEFDFQAPFAPDDPTLISIPLYVTRTDGTDFPLAEAVTALLANSFTIDSDGDGISNGTETQWAAFGFDWQVSQPALVASFTGQANTAGFFTESQLGALQIGVPLIAQEESGHFKLTIGVQKSTDLSTFDPFPITAPATTINAAGELEFLFNSPDEKAFFRLQAD